ncbi:sensor histidine kinase [Azospirillum sp. SYSU D00513]|uniref:sensor histidine kinase n=1 Tax=Azospirillum sp. SYSU D00513 TaxID=2812561 RepID=UPI001A96A8B3|nr:sensor histidine kinase [Azospirillum sp. SYSU D00513]
MAITGGTAHLGASSGTAWRVGRRPGPGAEGGVDPSGPSGGPVLRRGWTTGLFAATLLLAVTALALSLVLDRLADARALVQKTDRIILTTELLLSDLKDAETGQRGFLLTGEAGYLAPYEAAVRSVDQRLSELDVLTIVQEVRDHLPRLRALTREKLAELARTIDLRRRGDFEAALEVVRTHEGKHTMDTLRDEIAAMTTVERRLLEERTEAAEFHSRLATVIAMATSLFACLCAAAAYRIPARRNMADLRSSEMRFDATFEQAAVGIALVAPDGRWLRVNERLCAITGYGRAELLGGRFQSITHPDDLETDEAQVAALLRGEIQTYSLEKRYLRKDGGTVWVNLTVALVRRADGSPQYFISLIEDIAARKTAEFEVRRLNENLERLVDERTAELVEANRQLDAFAHTVSHDLRAPLRAVEGFSQALREDMEEGLLEEARAHARRIEAAVERMDGLIADVLAYSRAQQAVFPLEPVSLDRVLWNAEADLGPVFSRRGAEVEIARPLPAVLGNRAAVRQAVENLLTNAVKFVPPGTAPRVRVRTEEKGASVRLWVEDNGIGVPRGQQARIFEPFERLHGAEAYEGTGVGLAIVRKAVERMGGSCGVESEPGAGSRFWIELPRAPETVTQ